MRFREGVRCSIMFLVITLGSIQAQDCVVVTGDACTADLECCPETTGNTCQDLICAGAPPTPSPAGEPTPAPISDTPPPTPAPTLPSTGCPPDTIFTAGECTCPDPNEEFVFGSGCVPLTPTAAPTLTSTGAGCPGDAIFTEGICTCADPNKVFDVDLGCVPAAAPAAAAEPTPAPAEPTPTPVAEPTPAPQAPTEAPVDNGCAKSDPGFPAPIIKDGQCFCESTPDENFTYDTEKGCVFGVGCRPDAVLSAGICVCPDTAKVYDADLGCILAVTEAPTPAPTAVPPTSAPTIQPTNQPTNAPSNPPTEAPTSNGCTPSAPGLPTAIIKDGECFCETTPDNPFIYDTELGCVNGVGCRPDAVLSAGICVCPDTAKVYDADLGCIPLTATPTPALTAVPTIQPTNVPTSPPTNAPTAVPTIQPSPQPTSQPTFQPTNQPTNLPTAQPTNQPTNLPTNPPTVPPTSNGCTPSAPGFPAPIIKDGECFCETTPNDPFIYDTELGCVNGVGCRPDAVLSAGICVCPDTAKVYDADLGCILPTTAPTEAPTQVPTVQPTAKPVAVTDAPTAKPTNPPVAQTIPPTHTPTQAPTNAITAKPTNVLTQPPTSNGCRQSAPGFPAPIIKDGTCFCETTPNDPFIYDTELGCVNGVGCRPDAILQAGVCVCPDTAKVYDADLGCILPTTTPTQVPTQVPTVEVTAKPLAAPTPVPTIRVTAKPVAVPTPVPTVELTAKPVAAPTLAPTVQPVANPTAIPVATPTLVPAIEPTVQVTVQPVPVVTVAPTAKPIQQTLPPTAVLTFAPTNLVMPTPVTTLEPSFAAPTPRGVVLPTIAPVATLTPTIAPVQQSPTSLPPVAPGTTPKPTLNIPTPAPVPLGPTLAPVVAVTVMPTEAGASAKPTLIPVGGTQTPVTSLQPTIAPIIITATPTSALATPQPSVACIAPALFVQGACTCADGSHYVTTHGCVADPATAAPSQSPTQACIAPALFVQGACTCGDGSRYIIARGCVANPPTAAPSPSPTLACTAPAIFLNGACACGDFQVYADGTGCAPAATQAPGVTNPPPTVCVAPALPVNGVCKCTEGFIYVTATGCVALTPAPTELCVPPALLIGGVCTCAAGEDYVTAIGCVVATVPPTELCIAPALLVAGVCTCGTGSDYVTGVGCVVSTVSPTIVITQMPVTTPTPATPDVPGSNPPTLSPLNPPTVAPTSPDEVPDVLIQSPVSSLQSDLYDWIVYSADSTVGTGASILTQTQPPAVLIWGGASTDGKNLTTSSVKPSSRALQLQNDVTSGGTFSFVSALSSDTGAKIWSEKFDSTGSITSPAISTTSQTTDDGDMIIGGHASGAAGELELVLWQINSAGGVTGPYSLPRAGSTHGWAVEDDVIPGTVYVGGDTTSEDLTSSQSKATSGTAAESYVACFTGVGANDTLPDPTWAIQGAPGTSTVSLHLYNTEKLFAVTTVATPANNFEQFSVPLQHIDAPSSIVMALSSTTGAVQWQIEEASTITSSTVNDDGDILIAGCTAIGQVYIALLAGNTGTSIWTYDTVNNAQNIEAGCAMSVDTSIDNLVIVGGYVTNSATGDADAFVMSLSMTDGSGQCVHVVDSDGNDGVTTVSASPTQKSVVIVGMVTYGNALGVPAQPDTGRSIWLSMNLDNVCPDIGEAKDRGEILGWVAVGAFGVGVFAAVFMGMLIDSSKSVAGSRRTLRYTSATIGLSIVVHLQGWGAIKNLPLEGIPVSSLVHYYFEPYTWILQSFSAPAHITSNIMSVTSCSNDVSTLDHAEELFGNIAVVGIILSALVILHLLVWPLLQAHRMGTKLWASREDHEDAIFDEHPISTSQAIILPPPSKSAAVGLKASPQFAAASLHENGATNGKNSTRIYDDPVSPSNVTVNGFRSKSMKSDGGGGKKSPTRPVAYVQERARAVVSEYSLQTYAQMSARLACMFFPYVELAVFIVLLQGMMVADTSVLTSDCTALAITGGVLLIVPLLFIIFAGVVIYNHCAGSRSTFEYRPDEEDSRSMWKRLAEGVSEGYRNSESIYQFADRGSWYSRDNGIENTDAKAVRLGWIPIYADYNDHLPYFCCYIFIRMAVIALATSISTHTETILLVLAAMSLLFFGILVWKRPYNNAVAGFIQAVLLLSDATSITVLYCAEYLSNADLGDIAVYIQLGIVLLVCVPVLLDVVCTLFSLISRGRSSGAKHGCCSGPWRRYTLAGSYVWPIMKINGASFGSNIKRALGGSLYTESHKSMTPKSFGIFDSNGPSA